ncbi:MAG: nitroreductase family deazaflavin-dependent oxidoreductase [Gammaproteobacteria bacterium]|nr:nitroreductase family deazaflavin-dependent oxidoreductase [Gammaproteobacteria bacterium]MCY4198341.1 nitroreductase family deazaflavin-dependent oxidoreductase [Gammaproteobacteria bacterium]MCY4277993.1 nitroreductase family deazaflavin-dependent oxidoreductase [Gammaproteobacteria bacterium]MCY4324311.1 nitroreductase family deazaflavin-dependent oxidoreductase [Gammaproteobacteria bacterium]
MVDLAKKASDSGWIAQHRAQYLKDGEAGHLWDSSSLGGPGLLPTLLLFTIGRKTGEERIMPLIYGEVNSGYAIIASKGGFPSHPGWYHNLMAQERVKLQVKNKQFEATTRIAEGEERQKIWEQMAEIYPPYNDYQKSADERVIPVIVCERV